MWSVRDDETLKQLRNSYDFEKQAVQGKEFRTMVQLMVWVEEHLIGNGMCIPPVSFDAKYILDMTKKEGMQSNCYMYAVVLNEVYLSMGFHSRMVRCMPIDLEFRDCHCVTEVFSEEYQKWIVFDAANRAYYINKNLTPLNLFELRDHIIRQQTIFVPMMRRSDSEKLMKYFTKNLIRMESFQISRSGSEHFANDCVMLHFQSKNYPVSDKIVDYPELGIKITHLHTCNPDIFWMRPDVSSNSIEREVYC